MCVMFFNSVKEETDSAASPMESCLMRDSCCIISVNSCSITDSENRNSRVIHSGILFNQVESVVSPSLEIKFKLNLHISNIYPGFRNFPASTILMCNCVYRSALPNKWPHVWHLISRKSPSDQQ